MSLVGVYVSGGVDISFSECSTVVKVVKEDNDGKAKYKNDRAEVTMPVMPEAGIRISPDPSWSIPYRLTMILGDCIKGLINYLTDWVR